MIRFPSISSIHTLARAAKESGAKVYVLISAQAASAMSSLALPKMKGELEDSIMALGFEHTVILRPGLILGTERIVGL